MPIDAGIRFNPLIARLPENEQAKAVLFCGNLLMLRRHEQNFAAAVALIDFTDSLRNTSPSDEQRSDLLDLWNHIACRDAIMTIYHFEHVLRSICNAPMPASWASQVDRHQLEAAAARFSQRFPSIKQARNSVGHISELTSSIKGARRHTLEGRLYFGALKGRTYTITNRRVHHEVEMTANTRKFLQAIANEVDGAQAWLSGALT
jgi:hypothetical protein